MTACKELLKQEFPTIDKELQTYVESEFLLEKRKIEKKLNFFFYSH